MLKNLYRSVSPAKGPAATLLLSAVLMLLAVTYGAGQRFDAVLFGKLPQDYQLYPRDGNSEAKVPIAGVVETPGWKYVSVQVFRNNQPFQYCKGNIQYGSGEKGVFGTEATIRAERANYDFKVYLCKDTDSTLVVTRTRVVSGDVYILSGQSNATCFFGEPDTSMFCRTFGKITDILNTATYDPADTLWTLSNMHSYNNGVGTMGFEIQKQLMEHSGIPNCLINAGYHWSSAYSHSRRTENNPTDLTNGYGRMLYRARKAGVDHAVKAYIFRQGESEAYNEGGDWEGNFDILYKHLKSDFPALQKFYVFQIDVIYYPSFAGAILRDYQRRLPDIYPDIVTLATVGTTGFDGLHYNREGNKQSGVELSRLMLRDFYASADTFNITSPSIKKVFYSSQKNRLTLVFDESQQLKYPEPYKHKDGPLLDMKDFFFLNGQAGAVTGGRAEGNRVTLDLSSPQNASTLNYLPLYVEQGGPYFPFLGPCITNATGMRAFTFFNFPIANALDGTVLTARSDSSGGVKLSWHAVPGATGYILERKFGDATHFSMLARVAGNVAEWTDTPGETHLTITYRITAVSEVSESAGPAYAEVAPTLILGTEEDPVANFTVFPNPAQRGETVTIKFATPATGLIGLFDLHGRYLSGQKVSGGESRLTVPRHVTGVHFIQFEKGNRVFAKKLWVR
ncbi:sialate O-acetylesterase [Dyadobacter sp. 676]|uniref:Sialate O-acetylesterase n=1 Tax=Dyadobacter sp. 676 TaxID=3088362 RepID=A0AAU8FL75_9BACT